MSLENIKLPDFLIVDLYKNSLVELENVQGVKKTVDIKSEPKIPSVAQPAVATERKSIKFLGENKKNITVVVKEIKSAFINDTDLTFLTNILKACNLNLGDIAIVNTAEQKASYNELKDELGSTVILLFYIDPVEVNLRFTIPYFQV